MTAAMPAAEADKPAGRRQRDQQGEQQAAQRYWMAHLDFPYASDTTNFLVAASTRAFERRSDRRH